MKNIPNDSRRWIPFGAVKHLAVRLVIGATLTLSIAACVPMVDRCASVDTESARVIRVVVDDEILF